MARKAKEGGYMNTNAIMAYLAIKGIPKQMLNQIRVALCEDAVVNGECIQLDRIYTAVGLLCKRHLGLENKEVMQALRYFNNICASVEKEEATWPELMEALHEEANIVIHTSGDEIMCEYRAEEEVEENETINNAV